MIFSNDNRFFHKRPPHSIKPKFKIKQILILFFFGFLFLNTQAVANPSETSTASFRQTSFLSADGPISASELVGHIDYYLDSDWNKSALDMIGDDAKSFTPLGKTSANFGYTKNMIWLRFGIENRMNDNDQWRLHFQENFFQEFDVYVVRNVEESPSPVIEQLVALSQSSVFDKRPVAYPTLVAPVGIAPGEKVTVLVAYWSGGSSQLDVSLETADSFSELSVRRMIKNSISYGMILLLIIGGFLAVCILRQRVFFAYIAYVLSMLLFLLHADGTGFQYIWPKFPKFNSMGSVYFGSGVCISLVYYSRVFLNTKHYHPRLDKAMLSYIGAIVAVTIAGLLIDPQLLKQTLVFFALVGITLCILAGVVASLTRFVEVRFFILAWAAGLISVFIMNLVYVLRVDISQDMVFDSMRFTIVFDAGMMGLAIADRYNQLRNSRQKAMEESLAEAQHNLELSSRLHDLEEQYMLAADLAQSKDVQLKNTVHDLRQPLHALRLNIEKLKRGGKANTNEDQSIDETFTYLESLIADQLQQSVLPSNMVEAEYSVPLVESSEHAPLNLPTILKTIHKMFLSDATEKGLEFKYIETDHTAQIEPLVLMRIVTNLVSNAIKYTHKGKILLVTRRFKSGLRIELHDTGVGMSSEEFERAQNRDVRLPLKDSNMQGEVEGHGYGLAIARDLAIKHGLKLYVSPNRRQGTGIILEIPDSASDSASDKPL